MNTFSPSKSTLLQMTRDISDVEDKLIQLRETMETTEDDKEYERCEEEYETLEDYLMTLKSQMQAQEMKERKTLTV